MRKILLFALPVLLGNLFQQMYNMADTIIVGRFLGEDALAAVGSTGSIVYFVIGFTSGLTQGFSVLISRAVGARDQAQLRRLIGHAVSLTGVISAVLTVPTVLLSRQILIGMHVPESILEMAHGYLRIVFLGILCTMGYNVAASMLRAMGDSRTPLYFLVFSSVLNVGLDIFFLVVFRLGTAGVSLATLLSQGVSALLCFSYVFRNYRHLGLSGQDFRLNPKQTARMLAAGIPMALNQSIIATGIMTLQAGVNTFGPSIMASFAACSKIENLLSQPAIALSSGVTTFCGQNLGARRFDRIYRGVHQALAVGMLLGILGILFYYTCADTMIGFFVSDPSQELLAYARQYLHTTAWFLPVLAWIFLLRNSLVGLGHGLASMLGGLMELICRTLSVHFLLPVLAYRCICLTNPITWVLTVVVFFVIFLRWEIRQKRTTF